MALPLLGLIDGVGWRLARIGISVAQRAQDQISRYRKHEDSDDPSQLLRAHVPVSATRKPAGRHIVTGVRATAVNACASSRQRLLQIGDQVVAVFDAG
jgi:hypothetical protein